MVRGDKLSLRMDLCVFSLQPREVQSQCSQSEVKMKSLTRLLYLAIIDEMCNEKRMNKFNISTLVNLE